MQCTERTLEGIHRPKMTAYSAPGINSVLKINPVPLTDELIINIALENYYFYTGHLITLERLKKRNRDQQLYVYPRMIINALLREFKGYSYARIGLIWRLDHTTVLHSINGLKTLCCHQKNTPAAKSYALIRKLIKQGIDNHYYIN